ncbi:uncharacterized protein LOC143848590 [Tasmannia lanceolata]|uniref:uncharacterized protein LOC143848590 n=1 Tax=Tasmannia lanceolata TaxID=3420 RepID=UPI004063E762
MTVSSAQNLLMNPHYRLVESFYIYRDRPKFPFLNFSVSPKHGASTRLLEIQRSNSFKTVRWRVGVFESGEGIDEHVQREGFEFDGLNLDTFLSIIELLCIAPSVVFSIGCPLNSTFSILPKSIQASSLNRVFGWQFVLLVGAIAIGAFIRRRQWQKIWRDSFKLGSGNFNLIGRIDKLEENLRSSVTIIRVLSRQLEKLGIRFRVTRKALKGPITETAALSQKNSVATRALAMQEDILEKELGEIQKVLLAMQEHQQKQLELILAIAKSGRLRESSRDYVAKEQPIELRSSVPEKEEVTQVETGTRKQKGGNNDKV